MWVLVEQKDGPCQSVGGRLVPGHKQREGVTNSRSITDNLVPVELEKPLGQTHWQQRTPAMAAGFIDHI